MVESVEGDAEEALALGEAPGVWASKEVGVLLKDGFAVRTSVLL